MRLQYNGYILVTDDIVTMEDINLTLVSFKKFVAFINYIIKINGARIDNAGNLDLVTLMYNLIKYSSHCSDTSGDL